MQKYKLTISYDGTAYAGWQIQPNALSVQELIQKALLVALREKIALTGASRTDAGVHALCQTAHFETALPLKKEKLLHSLNGLLPPDIRILKIQTAPADFHSRFSAVSKTYHYHLWFDRYMDPFQRLYCHHVRQKIEMDVLEKAAKPFLGTHDFTSFANEADQGAAKNNPVKTMTRLDVVPQKGGVRLEFEATGFLYKMVRTIAGTMIKVASNNLALEEIEPIFQAKDRSRAGPALPPQGLFLVSILYKS